MQVFFLAALAFALLAVMFALQNIVPVRVTFLTWTFEGSLALILFVALIVGALVSVLISVPNILKGRWTISRLRKEIVALTAEIDTLRRQLDATRADVPRVTGEEPEPLPMDVAASAHRH